MQNIKPINEKAVYELEDKDFLLIHALQELTKAIKQLTLKTKYGV